MFLKKPFVSNSGKDAYLYVHCSDLPGDRALSQKDSFIQKMVLKRLFISDTVEGATLHNHCPGLLEASAHPVDHCPGLLEDSAHPVDTIVLLESWY